MKYHTWLLWEEPGEGCGRSRAMQHQQAKRSPTRAQPLQPVTHMSPGPKEGRSRLLTACKCDAGRKNGHRSFQEPSSPSPTPQPTPAETPGENPSQGKGGQIHLPAITLHQNTAWHFAISISPSSFFSTLSPSEPSQPTGITAGRFLRQVQPQVPLSRGSLRFCGGFTRRAVVLQPGWAPRIPRGAGGSGGSG